MEVHICSYGGELARLAEMIFDSCSYEFSIPLFTNNCLQNLTAFRLTHITRIILLIKIPSRLPASSYINFRKIFIRNLKDTCRQFFCLKLKTLLKHIKYEISNSMKLKLFFFYSFLLHFSLV